ncbi:MAG: hypothetical protein P8R42_01280 [Candidatus Binatia bacterium]|nr:hypothetical protein [Candidatus Binatia bacterium]
MLNAAAPPAARSLSGRGDGRGGGDPARDDWMEFEAPGRTLNHPRALRIGREVRCFDGEAGCDIEICFHNTAPDFPTCSPVEVTGVVAQDPATGAVLGHWSLPAQVQSAPVVVDGMVFVAWGDWTNDTGGLTAFKLD